MIFNREAVLNHLEGCWLNRDTDRFRLLEISPSCFINWLQDSDGTYYLGYLFLQPSVTIINQQGRKAFVTSTKSMLLVLWVYPPLDGWYGQAEKCFTLT